MNKYSEQKTNEQIEKIITSMKEQQAKNENWAPCWVRTNTGRPINFTTNDFYTGSNTFFCNIEMMINNYPTNQWATYKQIKALKIPFDVKGQSSITLVRIVKIFLKDKDNQPILDSNGNPKVFNKPKYFNVFNISQVKGLEHLIETIEVPDKATTIDNVQEFIDNCQAVIKFGGDRAFYSPGHDHIQMPDMDRFEDSYGYYSTMLHELVHWTMKEGRSNRPQSSNRSEYAFEELVAETGSALLCVMLGIESEPRPDHAKYLNSWIKSIKDNPKVIQQAFSQSQKAIDYLYSLQDQEEVKIAA